MTQQGLITTRVTDTSTGRPAVDVFVVLEHYQDSEHDWQTIAEGQTDDRGCIEDLVSAHRLEEGLYRVTFDTDAYFGDRDVVTFYSSVSINFQVTDPTDRYDLPLLLSPFGYSTYRAT